MAERRAREELTEHGLVRDDLHAHYSVRVAHLRREAEALVHGLPHLRPGAALLGELGPGLRRDWRSYCLSESQKTARIFKSESAI